MKYKMKIEYETEIEGDDEESAVESWWERLMCGNETAETWITDQMEITEMKE